MKSLDALLERQMEKSHPARGAWIEIVKTAFEVLHKDVAPRKGCVD